MVEETELGIKHEVKNYVDEVEFLVIIGPETFEEAASALVCLKKLSKKITTYFAPLKDAANKAHKAITTREKEELAPIASAESVIRGKRAEYKTAQDKIAEKEQRKLEEEERKRAADEQEKTLNEAAEAETPEQQEELLTKAEETVARPVFTPMAIEKTSKVATGGSTTWVNDISVEVQDIKLICVGIRSGLIPESVIQIQQGKLKTWVKTMNIRPGSVPGLFIKETQREVVRA